MAIEFRCRNCGKGMRVADSAAGKRGTCPKCGAKFVAPAAAGAEPPLQGSLTPPVSAAGGPRSPSFGPDVAPALNASAGHGSSAAAHRNGASGEARRARARRTPVGLMVVGAVAGLACGAVVTYFVWKSLSGETPATGTASVAAAPASGTNTPSATTQNTTPDSTSPATTNKDPSIGKTPVVPETSPPPTPGTTPDTTPPPVVPPKNQNDPSGPTPSDPAPPTVPSEPKSNPPENTPPDNPPSNPAANPGEKPPGENPAVKPEEGDPKKPAGNKTDKPEKRPVREPRPTKGTKPGNNKKDPNEPEMAFAEDGTCLYCLGLQFVPLTNPKAYVHFEGEKAPKPETCVPWRPCPHCQNDRDPQELVDAEAARLVTWLDSHKSWEQRTTMQYSRVETKHAAIHAQLPADAARRQGMVVEALANHLQTLTRSILLTQSRPDSFDMLINADSAAHAKFLALAPNLPEFAGTTDWLFVSTLGGFTGDKTSVFSATKVKDLPPEHVTLFYFSGHNMLLASRYKSKDWLQAGFQYYGEHAITKKNRVYSISYKANEPPLNQDWNAEVRKALAAKRMRGFELMFRVELRDYTVPDHLQAYSMVGFLLTTEPRTFLKLVQNVAAGQGDQEAVEGSYGKTLKELEAAWVKWAMGQ
ncbi:MAG: hypothetical protein HYS13_04405 [Planctomycetia bacterium]|nr:hypothetical protein [Planctomycetia bacterium]